MPGVDPSRISNGLQPTRSRHSRARRWSRRVAWFGGALLCVLSAGGAIAYYTTAETPGASEPRRSAANWRFAEASDTWTDALRTPEFWKKLRSSGGSSDERSSRRARRSSSESEHRHRSRETGSSERASRREQASTREHSSRPIRESVESHRRPTYTTPVLRAGTIRHYSVISHEVATYRTMCVRLCDGYYWPVSYSATKQEFGRDNEICQRSCESPVALYVHKNPGEEAESMIDLKGNPYIALDTAFMYRAAYDEACKCRPHPWEEAARQRHLSYEAAAQPEAAAVGKP